MKGVVFLGDRKLELREFPDPTPGPRDVVLEIKASGCAAATCTTIALRPIRVES
jgi:D-arabinose 1-dehydrogenase-like Zn-dependent alcohol dehydrogenase